MFNSYARPPKHVALFSKTLLYIVTDINVWNTYLFKINRTLRFAWFYKLKGGYGLFWTCLYRCTNFYDVPMNTIYQRRKLPRKWPHITCILISIYSHTLWFTRVSQCRPIWLSVFAFTQNNWVQYAMRHINTYTFSLMYITTRLI